MSCGAITCPINNMGFLAIISWQVRKNILPLPFQYIKEKMKRSITIISMLLAFASVFSSCSTKVDLYADYKEIPVIYGLLDNTKDTNYVKIIRAFSGSDESSVNANEVALIPDSNNYPGKLDARIYEEKSTYTGGSYNPTGRVFELDTMTIHDKEPGDFYSPDQKVYYTTERFLADNGNTKYRYRLEVIIKGDTVSATSNIVGGDRFYVTTNIVDLDPTSTTASKVKFLGAENAYVYELKMQFNYKETHSGQETKNKKVEWSLGTYNTNEMDFSEFGNFKEFEVSYKHEALFNMLNNKIDADTANVERLIGDLNILIAAGGSELYNYIEVNAPSTSISQNISDYTNINGGYGVFSSRINISQSVKISPNTITALIGKSGWGFKQDLGE